MTKRLERGNPREVQKLSLKYKGISPKTRHRYESQIKIFFSYLTRNDIVLPSLYRQLDTVLSDYIDHMFMEGEPIGYAGDLISGISRFCPGARLRIPTTRLWFRNWQREVVRVRALPIPAEVVKGLAGVALAMERFDLAALIPLGFLCMMRTGELLNLTKDDIIFSPYGSSAIITLRQTKTSGPNTEEGVLEDELVVRALRQVCDSLNDGENIYSRPARCLGEDLRWLASLVGFEHKRFTPYSLRRGGATWHFHKFGSLNKTCLVGRWKHERTAKIYIDGAAAEWTSWQFPLTGKSLMKRCRKAWKQKFSAALSRQR